MRHITTYSSFAGQNAAELELIGTSIIARNGAAVRLDEAFKYVSTAVIEEYAEFVPDGVAPDAALRGKDIHDRRPKWKQTQRPWCCTLEETQVDPRNARYVNADVGGVEVILVPEVDPEVNPAGVKGIGELGNVGVPSAIANAIYHATGTRVRHLPIRVEDLLTRV